jgi:hypothetical protein
VTLEKKAAGPELDLAVLFVWVWPLSDKLEDALRRLVSEKELVIDVSTCNVRALVSGGPCCVAGPGVGVRYLGFI